MDVWYQCEIPYPHVPQDVLDRAPSVRASLPNRYCDPKVAADLFEECIDEFLLADDLGLNVVGIEHHAGINSLLAANPMLVGILARQTKKARILSLGTLVTLRPDPVRIAEEYATADVISRGRLEIGFVKSGGSESASSNVSMVDNGERYWEAIDLISKALTSHDGPFSWEGKHFTHRHVNIWPPAFQRPLPRMWSATGDASTSADVGRRGLVHVLVLRAPKAPVLRLRQTAALAWRPGCRLRRPSALLTRRSWQWAKPKRKACVWGKSCCGFSTPASSRRRSSASSCRAPRRPKPRR